MGVYLKPSEVPTKGRKLPLSGKQYEAYTRQVRNSEQMIMELDNGVQKIYPVIKGEEEFNDFYSQYGQGWYVNFDVWAVPRSDVDAMINTGR